MTLLPWQSAKQVKAFDAHPSPIQSLAISPDGRILVSGSFNGVV